MFVKADESSSTDPTLHQLQLIEAKCLADLALFSVYPGWYLPNGKGQLHLTPENDENHNKRDSLAALEQELTHIHRHETRRRRRDLHDLVEGFFDHGKQLLACRAQLAHANPEEHEKIQQEIDYRAGELESHSADIKDSRGSMPEEVIALCNQADALLNKAKGAWADKVAFPTADLAAAR